MLIVCLTLILSAYRSYAWSNGGYSSDPYSIRYGTHDWIAEHALDWLPSEAKSWILEYMNWYLYGTELPDNGRAPDGIGDTHLHHVYFDADGRLTDDSAARRANDTYRQALSNLLLGNLTAAAKYVGAMTHYIADMAVFGHVMGEKTCWGGEKHHSDYEAYVDSKTSSYRSEFELFLSFDGELRIISAYDAAVELAYDTTFDRLGRGLTCLWMDRNYNWSNPIFVARVGESLNLAVNYVADVLYTLYMDYKSMIELFDIRISSDPCNGSAIVGGSISTKIYVDLAGGMPRSVKLSVVDLPLNTSYTLSVESGIPPLSSNLTIYIGREAKPGVYNITIIADYEAARKTTIYKLTIIGSGEGWVEQNLPSIIIVSCMIAIVMVIVASKRRGRRRPRELSKKS